MEIGRRTRIRATGAGSDTAVQGSGPPSRKGTVALIVVALIIVTAFVYVVPNLPSLLHGLSSYLSRASTSQGSSENYTLYSPVIENGSANITFPPGYGTLASYSLVLINDDRANFSLGPVALSQGNVAQQHADSMLKYDYFSHYDTQGYKPYMRYTLLGGLGAVFENVAYIAGGRSSGIVPIEKDLKLLEHLMMYNDSLCCNNGHRLNILNSLHDFVSVGVAYNSTTVYFVEDFESRYVNMSFSISPSYDVSLRGAVLSQRISSTEALITFDATPTPETRYQLNNGPHEYDPGTVVGGVSSCRSQCTVFNQGITVYASSWVFTSATMDVSFSLSQFIAQSGPGVYTIYLLTGNDTNTAITSISVFVAPKVP